MSRAIASISESWDMADDDGRIELDVFVDADRLIYLEVFDTSGTAEQVACVTPSAAQARELAAALLRAADLAADPAP